jgi:hypothetical protein
LPQLTVKNDFDLQTIIVSLQAIDGGKEVDCTRVLCAKPPPCLTTQFQYTAIGECCAGCHDKPDCRLVSDENLQIFCNCDRSVAK